MCACLVAQFCPALCKPMDYIPSGSCIHEILQARILEWVAIPFPRGSSWPRDLTGSPALPADSLPFEPPGKPFLYVMHHHIVKILCFFLLQAWAFSFTLLYKKSIATVHLGKILTEMNGGQFYWEIMWCLGENEHILLLILKDQRKAISWNLQKQQALHCL